MVFDLPATVPVVELCQAQYCVPKPEALLPDAVSMTNCTSANELYSGCCAARTASAASWLCVGRVGAAEPVSQNCPATRLSGKDGIGCEQLVAPDEAPTEVGPVPMQYCFTELTHALDVMAWKKLYCSG